MDALLLLTAEETAKLLHIGRCKVYDLIRNNELRSIKIGGARRIPRSAVEEYVARLLDDDAA
ncbi:helix-turn-helix domain-containing protein [Pseudonocardia sp. HH130629-09]|uniref:helix-turn-helix domain-containing protein n=1 Tax=Pseudonocardia sp. HH130629-09 TaxID=1641402 RepID=UPI0006CAFAD1|nr:helix-turn-helix domain-containing protein [Pseudonocardia sp. HH130629-09]ALE82242.1 transcriptional regulator [Pseudonocardia sp. HH130629-09]